MRWRTAFPDIPVSDAEEIQADGRPGYLEDETPGKSGD
jgi:hypothetical protein